MTSSSQLLQRAASEEGRSQRSGSHAEGMPQVSGSRADLLRFLWLVVQLGLLAWVLSVYRIENVAFRHVAALTFVGALIHHFLPMGLKLPFFVAISVTALGMVVGAVNAAWLVGIALALIGACHLPISFGKRVAVVVALGAAMVAFQAGWLPSGELSVILPILGSMFCFRLAVYLYDMKHREGTFGFWRSVAYFFMSPNVCFLLFPVVDYKTFCRTYYNDDPLRIYQSGATWISRGLVQLVLYRFVYHFLVMDPSQVASIGDMFRYITTTFLLYLKVSGTFHVIVGMLHLFGFNLPETHHRWLLASSFIDFWQRINIYWKEFMMKLIFYPAYFRLRTMKTLPRLVLATAISMTVTWLLHSYQWFWIRGTYLLTAPDALFWAILGALLTVNMVWQQKFSRQKKSLKQGLAGRSWGAEVRLALRTIATLVTICVLWSMWSAESFGDWFALWVQAAHVGVSDVLLIGGVLLAVGVAAVLLGHTQREWGEKAVGPAEQGWLPQWKPGLAVVASCLVLLAPANAFVASRLDPQVASVAGALRRSRLNKQDMATLHMGYYEELTQARRFNPQLFELYAKTPAKFGKLELTEAIRPTGDYRLKELVPLVSVEFNGRTHSTNEFGMRDRRGQYQQHKPAGVFRIAQVGASASMGWGVGDGETFENLLEDRLNETNDGSVYSKYEVLNFAVNGYGPVEKLMTLEGKALAFEPDMVFYTANLNEYDWTVDRLITALQNGTELPYDFLKEVLEKAQVGPQTHKVLARGRLRPYAPQIVAQVYQRFVSDCRERGVEAVWVYVPLPGGEEKVASTKPEFQSLAVEAGFLVLDLSHAYHGASQDQLRVAEWDGHPNWMGHRLLEQSLYNKLLSTPSLSRYWPDGKAVSVTTGEAVDGMLLKSLQE